jgi:pimeloyl-ACP methyl ester carboxylesterase
MYFLCLHGQGTNSEVSCLWRFPVCPHTNRMQIFHAQTVSLRYELGTQHDYEFLEGTVPAPLAEEMKAYYPSSTRTWNYFDHTTESKRRALDQLHAFISIEGPFDGVIAYSAGAAFAATYMIQQAQHGASPFRCAVFFSSGRPLDTCRLAEGELRFLDPSVDRVRIDIPTAHIWGANDTVHPRSWESLRGLCVADSREEVVHMEGHDVPSGRAKEAVVEITKAIRRTVARAEGSDVEYLARAD